MVAKRSIDAKRVPAEKNRIFIPGHSEQHGKLSDNSVPEPTRRSPQCKESGFRNAGNIFAGGIQNPRLWDPGITITAQKESEISLTSGVKNPGINDKD